MNRPIEIIEGYMPPYPNKTTKPRLVVRCGVWFLRYSRGPKQGHFWDAYGDDYLTLELAELAISQAPPVPNGKPWIEFSIPLEKKEH